MNNNIKWKLKYKIAVIIILLAVLYLQYNVVQIHHGLAVLTPFIPLLILCAIYGVAFGAFFAVVLIIRNGY